jgi:hypothetical protein
VDAHEARQVLGVAPDASWTEVRAAYRARIRAQHPDRAGAAGSAAAIRTIEAFRVLERLRHEPRPTPSPPGGEPGGPAGPGRAASGPRPPGRSDHGFTEPGPTEAPPSAWQIPLTGTGPPPFTRLDGDTLHFAAPADETFRWLLEVAHEIGEVTYLDRSGPIMEVLCRFEGEPATSLLVSTQGRAHGTDAFCSAESIEARPGPPTALVVDLMEAALGRLALPPPPADPGF